MKPIRQIMFIYSSPNSVVVFLAHTLGKKWINTGIKSTPSRMDKSLSRMYSIMSCFCNNNKVFNTVISFNPIYMVNQLSGKKIAADVFFHYQTVLHNISVMLSIWMVFWYTNMIITVWTKVFTPLRAITNFSKAITLPTTIFLASCYCGIKFVSALFTYQYHIYEYNIYEK